MASLFALATPKRFLDLSAAFLPWLGGATILSLGAGVILGFLAPPDYQQGDTVKLTLMHEAPKPGSKFLESVSDGWPVILASLKSLLETGESLEATRKWPEGM